MNANIIREKLIEKGYNVDTLNPELIYDVMKIVELREKCEDVVYDDPDAENDHCEMIAEIVCSEFNIM